MLCINKVLGVTPCGAVKSTFRLPPQAFGIVFVLPFYSFAFIRLYKAYILPHLEYCSPLLLGISNGLKNKLEDTNYYILRTILNCSRAVSYDFLLNKA